MEGLATMHAQYWDDPEIQASDALYPFSTWADIYPPAIETGWPLYEAHFSYDIDDDLMPYFKRAMKPQQPFSISLLIRDRNTAAR